MAQFKVSYVVEDGTHPGGLVNTRHEPRVGDRVQLDGYLFEVTEIQELMPSNGDFGLIHATCRQLRQEQ